MECYIVKEFDFKGNVMDLWACVAGEPYAFFLDSSQYDPSRGRFSCIGFNPFDTFIHKGKDALALLKEKVAPFMEREKESVLPAELPLASGVVGYLSYDYGLYHERMHLRAQDDLGLPDAFFGFYDCVLTIDHFAQKLFITSSGLPQRNPRLRKARAQERLAQAIAKISPCLNGATPIQRKSDVVLKQTATLCSNFTRENYERAVDKALEYIAQGDIYQVNLSQRFELDCAKAAFNPRMIYQALRELSPVSFGGYLDCGNFTIISNSPERFLRLQKGRVQTRPMKGTRPRGETAMQDQALRMELVNSLKEKAELLMITDLLRNDLGKVCDYGSVRVREMRTIEEYGYVFQATSTVEGHLKKDKDCFDLLSACFPGGSVTGCPKIRAMEIIEELEPTRRGIYTGALGYINFKGDMDFNILIRTLLARQNKMYFQVGGGIVSDSTPEKEYEETLVKARAIQAVLGTGEQVPAF